ncbi:DPP IV N-terminal domain-containing protein [candidate division KSB1 bacterium]
MNKVYRVSACFVLTALMVSFFLGSASFAQEAEKPKANYKLAEKFLSNNVTNNLLFDTSVRPNWIENTEKFWYRFKNKEGTEFYVVDPEDKTKEPVFDNAKLAAGLSLHLKKPFDPKHNPVSTIKFVKENKVVEFQIDSLKFEYDLASHAVTFIDTVRRGPRAVESWRSMSPDSNYVVFARNHNLYVMGSDSIEHQLTTDGELWYSFGSSDSDTTMNKRLRARPGWFKDSNKFYIVRQDRREVNDLWVINALSDPRPTLETYKYPMPGEDNVPQYELWLFDAENRTSVKANAEKYPDQAIGGTYIGGGGIFMDEGDDKLYIVRRSRDWKDIELCVTDTETGEVTTLVTERTEPYFNVRYIQLAVLNEGKDLIWWSDRDGWGHFYLYDENGNLKSRMTSGPWMANNIAKIDTTGRVLYFTGCGREPGEDPYYLHTYRVNFDGTGLKLLNPGDANHSTSISTSNEYFVDNYSRVDQVPKAALKDNMGNHLMDLETIDISRLEEAGFKMPEPFHVKAADGVTDLYGVMWKPFDFDPEKEYPIINYVYPGPQTESVPKGFTATDRNVPLAQLGFIVIVVGNRGGSPQRNNYYHTYGYQNARDYGLADKKAVIEQLASRHSFIDVNRVGIYGHSGGGFMSTAAVLVYPDFFKVAVSSAGNHDNNIYNIWWGENHYGVEMQTKTKKDKDGNETEEIDWVTKITTNPEVAENLKGHLLLVHGDMDNNVHSANSIRVANALIKANKRFDFMIMPGKRHGFGDYQNYFNRLLWDYFCEHLIGDSNKNVDLFEIKK